MDDQKAVFGDPPACQVHEPSANVIGKAGRVAHVKSDLDGGGNLVYILAARSGCTDKILLYFTLVN